MELMKQALEMACREEFEKLEEQKELEELIKERILVLLVYEMVIFEEGTFDEADFALALERLEEAWPLVADLVKNAVSSRDGLIFHMLMRVLEHAQDLYEKASQPEKAKAMLEQGLQWCKELLKERVANSAYWKEQKLQWAYDIWWLVRDISKRYIELFLLYEEDNEKEKMQEVLKEMEEFADSKVLLELRDKIERKQNYALCQARLDDDIAQGYERLEDYDKAEEFYLKALENLDQAQRKRKTYYGRRMLEENFNALLTLYEKMNQPEKAREIKARQKQVLDKLDEYEEDEDNFYDDEMFRFTLFEADLEYLESRGERAFDF